MIALIITAPGERAPLVFALRRQTIAAVLNSDAAQWASAAAHRGVDHKEIKAVLALALVTAGIPPTTASDQGGDVADGIADRIWRYSPTGAAALAAQLVAMAIADTSPIVELH